MLGSQFVVLFQGGGAPPPGYVFLRGQIATGYYVILRGQTSAGVYVNLSGKVA